MHHGLSFGPEWLAMEASGLVPLFGDRANADLALNLDMSTLFLLFPWYLANLNDGGDRPLTAY